MTTLTADTLEVPGARLYYEVRGAGPALLLITGGSGDPMIYQRIADALADRYTVISYERRGFSRSPLAEPPDDEQRIATDTDDVIRLLDALIDEPAAIFGSSSGAIVGLDVITKHPDRVRSLVCHEPPLARLVPDWDQWLGFFDAVYASYQRDGLGAAMQEFNAAVGMDDLPERPPDTELPPPVMEMLADEGQLAVLAGARDAPVPADAAGHRGIADGVGQDRARRRGRLAGVLPVPAEPGARGATRSRGGGLPWQPHRVRHAGARVRRAAARRARRQGIAG